QRGGGETDRALGDQGRAFAGVDRMPLHVDEEIEVAAARAADSGLAFAGDADARAFVDSGGDLHRQLALVERAAFALAIGARVADHFTRAAACRAAALDHEKALLRPDLAHSAAGRAGAAAIVRAGAAAPVAHLAAGLGFDGDRLLDAGEGF